MQSLREAKFEEKESLKPKFIVLYQFFNKLVTHRAPEKSVSNLHGDQDSAKQGLADFEYSEEKASVIAELTLMKDCLDLVESETYSKLFGAFDKKLRKNVIKRCVVEPLIDHYLCNSAN
jgi:hypothetical protein